MMLLKQYEHSRKEGESMETARKALHPKDLQTMFGISRSTVYRLCKLPDFPSYKVGKRVVIDPDELDKWIKEGGKVNENQ